MIKVRLSFLGLRHIAVCLMAFFFVASCSKEPAHLSEGKMEDLLYDLHTAQALIHQAPSDSVKILEQLYREAILHKYDLTEEELEENLIYYSTNADRLFKIYERMAARLENVSSGNATAAPVFTEGGDTLNLWTAGDRLLLLANGSNWASFTIEADTLLQPGDRMEWHLTSSSIYPEGERNMQASFRLEYADSTSVFTRSVGGYGTQTIDIPVSETRTPKRLYISLMQNTTWGEKPKLLALSKIYLLRIRPQKIASVAESIPDSLNAAIDSTNVNSETTKNEQKDSLSASSSPQRRHPLTPGRRAVINR